MQAIQATVRAEIQATNGLYKSTDRQQLGLGTPVIRKIGSVYSKQVDDKTMAAELFRALFQLGYYEYSLIGAIIYGRYVKQMDLSDKTLIQQVLTHHVHDWAVCDVYGLELLGPYLYHSHNAPLAETLLRQPGLWVRRCGWVALVYLVRRGQAWPLAGKLLQQETAEPERLVKKAMVWLQRELDKARSKA